MKSALNIIITTFVVLPLLILSYQIGTPNYLAGSAVGQYFKEPALKLTSAKASPTEKSKKILLERNMAVPDVIIAAGSALAWDFKNDFYLYSKNTVEPRPIASLTKLVTAALVLDYAQAQETTSVSEKAIKNAGDSGNLRAGEVLTVKDLLAAALLESSNDAAYALAEYIGSKLQTNPETKSTPVREFVRMMNQKFNDLGLVHSNFADPAGLEDIDSFSTAEDFSKFVKYLRENPNYTPVWEILQLKNYQAESLNGIAVHSLKTTNPFLDEYTNVIGGKTGYTPRALGNMLLVTAGPNNTEIIYLVLGSGDRFGEIRKLVKWAGEAWRWPIQTN